MQEHLDPTLSPRKQEVEKHPEVGNSGQRRLCKQTKQTASILC